MRTTLVTSPHCERPFSVEYNPSINGSFYHAVTGDGKREMGASSVHTRTARNLKCPYCHSNFIERGEW